MKEGSFEPFSLDKFKPKKEYIHFNKGFGEHEYLISYEEEILDFIIKDYPYESIPCFGICFKTVYLTLLTNKNRLMEQICSNDHELVFSVDIGVEDKNIKCKISARKDMLSNNGFMIDSTPSREIENFDNTFIFEKTIIQ